MSDFYRERGEGISRRIWQIVCVGCLALGGGCARYRPLPLNQGAVDRALGGESAARVMVDARAVHHPLLPPTMIRQDQGITPDEAAVIAAVANPSLRAVRDQRAVARAAVLQAGILPNPQLTGNYDWVTGGNTLGAVNAWGLGVNYDVSALLSHQATVESAKATARSIDLSIAWQEWQTAEAAKQATYDVISLTGQLNVAREIDQRLAENLDLLRKAEAAHLKTALDVSAAEAAARDAHATVLQAARDLERQRLLLNHALGVPASAQLRVAGQEMLPLAFAVPNDVQLLAGMDGRRLDLVALRESYQSQEQTLRAAVLNQLPRINIGFERSNDDTAVHLAGPTVSIDLPLFDRNQGVIATETATRQRLFDEYTSRVYDARSDIATALADLRAINGQIADAQAALPNLRELVEVYRRAVAHGNADVLSYYQVWNNLAQKNLDVLKLQQQLGEMKVALELASGQYFPDQATSGAPATQPVPSADTAMAAIQNAGAER